MTDAEELAALETAYAAVLSDLSMTRTITTRAGTQITVTRYNLRLIFERIDQLRARVAEASSSFSPFSVASADYPSTESI